MKYTVLKNNFSAGELSTVLATRTDIAQYSNGAKTLTNVIPLVEGGVRKRPGTFFCAIKPGALRLIPFVVSSSKAYILIVSAYQIEVYHAVSKTVVITLATPYSSEAITDLQYVHTRYTMYFTHPDYPVQWLRCSEDITNWSFSPLTFDIPPMDEVANTPNVALTPSGKDVGQVISLTAADYPTWVSTVTYFEADRVFYLGSTWEALSDNVNSIPAPSNVNWKTVPASEATTFTPTSVGAIIQINGGYVRITEYVSKSLVKGEVLVELDAVVQAIAKSWVLKTTAFNGIYGYPKCCTFFKQRLVFGNTKKFPNKVWFSRIANPTNFLETTEDADAFSVVSSSDQADSILFLVPQKGVIALTSGAEFLLGSDGALTPTTIQIDEHTAWGSYAKTRPCRIGSELLFVQRGGERLRALSYRYEVDGLVSPEISSVASHIGETNLGITEITYQQEPESLVWCVLGNGRVASITFNREQEVVAWAQQDFGGVAKSICSVPTQLGSDLCFMLINRNGTMVLEEISFNAYSDCERTIVLSGSNQFSAGTFSYLNNLSIAQTLESSRYTYDYSIENNIVTLDALAGSTHYSIQVGKTFESKIEVFPPELSQSPASSLTYKAKIHLVAFFFNKTQAPKLNNQLLELYEFSETPMDAQKPYTGRYIYEGGDWNDLYNVELTITHDKPLPFHMQAVAISISLNER